MKPAFEREEGFRLRGRLRRGFEDALSELGQGFLAHPSNHDLREALRSGKLGAKSYLGQLLRLTYRLVFLLSVEERGLLHPTGVPSEARKRYATEHGLGRHLARSPRPGAPDRETDLWAATTTAFRGLSTGEAALGLPALGGLFADDQCPDLDDAKLDNRRLLSALSCLGWVDGPRGPSRLAWRDIGPDELGYVYEGLLELVPQVDERGCTFGFARRGESRGHTRKTTGSYYTPDSLLDLVLDAALEPVIEATLARASGCPADALLALRVVDPACGSGHFLLAAARRLAGRVARLRAGDPPAPDDYRAALRDVIDRCVYGVDLDPLAVELCRVALWMEAAEPGQPLSFVDAHVQRGNALVGTTRALMGNGVPDSAWMPLEGDDRKLAASSRRRNKSERGRVPVPTAGASPRDDALAAQSWEHQKLVHDAWCAAFLWPMQPSASADAPTQATWSALRDGVPPSPGLVETIQRVANDYAFFHWELAFPEVFARGGFDVVLGNPPWERVKLQEQEFFASRDNRIASALNASVRKKLIAELPVVDSVLWAEWTHETRIAQGTSHFARQSGRYPLCGRGDLNTYALFAEHNWTLVGPRGRAGFIVPSGIATDATTRDYFEAIVRTRALAAMWEFENEGFFTAGKGHVLRFALTTLTGSDEPADAPDFVFQAQSVRDLEDPERHFALTAEDIETVNPNTGTCPIFRTKRDARLTVDLYRRAGVLWREDAADGNPWSLRFAAMMHMANDSGLFQTRQQLSETGWRLDGNRFVRRGQVRLPLYEAKMAYLYNHRSGTFERAAPGHRPHRLPRPSDAQLAEAGYAPLPFYWVAPSAVESKLGDAWSRKWLLGWREITDARASVRTMIPVILPFAGVSNKVLLMLTPLEPTLVACLTANLASLPLDYCCRQKLGGISLNYFTMRQVPALDPATYGRPSPWSDELLADWILPRVLELTYTAWDLAPFARDCGDDGAPFVWSPERRLRLRSELDAAFFLLYQFSRDDVEHVLGTFDVLHRADVRRHGDFRTRRVVLDCHDALSRAIDSGEAYVSPLGPARRSGE